MAVVDVINELTVGIDALVGFDPGLICDGDAIAELYRQLDRLEAVAVRATARFDADGAYSHDGARNASAWLASRCRMPASTAKRRVRLGRALRHMPLAEQRWLAGDICSAHAGLLASARETNADAFARDEADLVDNALRLRFGAFARTTAYWCRFADPDGAENKAGAQYDSRHLHLSQSFENTWRLDGQLDPISGSIVSAELERIERELFKADWAEAEARLGPSVRLSVLVRTPTQRRADALVEMARRSAALPRGSRLPEPLFTVLVGYETFAGPVCELANKTVVTPGTLGRWLDEAWLERIVFDGPSRVIDVGVRRRLFSGATRKAVQVRDGECFHPTCEIPAQECEIDHVEPFSAGGLTTQANGRAACGFHNRQRHPPAGEPDP